MDCMITHPAFVLAVLSEVVAAGAGRIIIADAPIQIAKFELITPPEDRRAGDTLVADFKKLPQLIARAQKEAPPPPPEPEDKGPEQLSLF